MKLKRERKKSEKQNKYSLLKVLGLSFLFFAVLTWLIPAGVFSGAKYSEYADGTLPVGLFGLFQNPLYSFGIFAQYFLVLMAIGGFYGVLEKTGAYAKLINNFKKGFEKHRTLFLIIVISMFAILNTVVGNSIALFILVPFFTAILLKLGYSKVTSLAATIGAIIVGGVGSVFGTSALYRSLFGIDFTKGIWIKVIFFVLVTLFYILFILMKEGVIKIGKKKKEKTNEKVKEEVVEEKELHIDNKKSVVPLIVIFVVTMALILVGVINWEYTFNVSIFTDFYETITEIGFLNKLFGNLPVIGYFGNYEIAAILLIVSFLTKWVYSIKFDNFIEAFTDGCKKMIKPAIYVVFASVIFAVMVNNEYNISATITNWLFGIVNQFNVLITTLVGLVGGFFFHDYLYLVDSMYGVLAAFNSEVYTAMLILVQTGHGIAMLCLPVSIILVAGLKYLDVPYTKWLKYIYKFLLIVFVFAILFSLIVL